MTRQVPEQVISDIAAALERDPAVDRRNWALKVRSHDGRVVLDGSVEDIVAKRRACRLAAGLVADEYPLTDRVRVSGHDVGDRELATGVLGFVEDEPVFRDYALYLHDGGALMPRREPDLARGRIEVSARDGVVTLAGYVNSPGHWRMAEVLAWWNDGCRLLENRLEVIPPREEDDGEITDAVRMVLEKDPLVDTSGIHVQTKGRVVHLEGFAKSQEEKRIAVLDTWYVPGLRGVEDRIETP